MTAAIRYPHYPGGGYTLPQPGSQPQTSVPAPLSGLRRGSTNYSLLNPASRGTYVTLINEDDQFSIDGSFVSDDSVDVAIPEENPAAPKRSKSTFLPDIAASSLESAHSRHQSGNINIHRSNTKVSFPSITSSLGSKDIVGVGENTQDKMGSRNRRSYILYGDSETDSESYDTDLDADDEDEQSVIPVEKVQSSVHVYNQTCNNLEIYRQSTIVQTLPSKKILLRHRNIGPSATQALAAALKDNATIEDLELGDTGIGPQGAIYIATALAENEFVTRLNLSENLMGIQGAAAMTEMIKTNKTITHLNLAGNNFGEKGAEYIAYGIANNNSIVELDLSHNAFDSGAGFIIGKAMNHNTRIKKLNLSYNYFHASGAVYLAKMLNENVVLTHLDLSWNGFGYEGCVALKKVLKVNDTLEELDISNNSINWQGALMMSEGLKKNTALQVLKMGYNPLTTTGAMDLIEAVSSNSSGLMFLSIPKVEVIGEFELLAVTLQQEREGFRYEHGGVVSSHDIIGQRTGRRIVPLQRVMNFIKENELRATDLFRAIDKSVSNKVDNDDFVTRIQKAGINLQRHEIEELIRDVEAKTTEAGTGKGSLNFKKLVRSMQEQNMKERKEKIRERERQKKLEEYHHKILKETELPPLGDESANMKSSPNSPASTMFSSLMLTKGDTPRTLSGIAPPAITTTRATGGGGAKFMSMSTGLGEKTKGFGDADKKKKKKKKKSTK